NIVVDGALVNNVTVNNATGKIDTKVIAIRSGGGFSFYAPNELTVSSNVWGLSGITANGNVFLSTGTFPAGGGFPAYDLTSPVTDYYNAATGKYKAGLMLEGGITAGNNIVYLDSASGIFQWANDNSSGTARPQSKISAGRLLLSGKGQFNLMTAENAVKQFAGKVTGSIMYNNGAPLTIDTYGIN